jgi:hypothetical protein
MQCLKIELILKILARTREGQRERRPGGIAYQHKHKNIDVLTAERKGRNCRQLTLTFIFSHWMAIGNDWGNFFREFVIEILHLFTTFLEAFKLAISHIVLLTLFPNSKLG